MLFNIKKKIRCTLSLITMHSACDSNKNIAADALYALGCGGILRSSLYNKALTPYRLLCLRVQSNRCSWKTSTTSHKSRQHSFHIMFTRNTLQRCTHWLHPALLLQPGVLSRTTRKIFKIKKQLISSQPSLFPYIEKFRKIFLIHTSQHTNCMQS